jgi:exonuclease SbcC
MNIELKKLAISYFKGIRSLTIQFGQVTNILGDNATGKTTIFDAFLWLLFGKDSTDRTTFEIKTLDKDGAALPKIEHEVSAVILVDDREHSIRRVFREKWVKKRGSIEQEFAGNETLYFFNDVPLQQKEFQDKVNAMVNENLFKLITNAFYFNSVLNWQGRRGVLMELAGAIDDTEVLDRIATLTNKDSVLQLTNELNAGKKFDEYKSQLAARKKKLKDELVLIPTRIDELSRTLPQEALSLVQINSAIEQLEKELETIDTLITSKSKAAKDREDQRTKVQEQIFTLQRQIASRKNKLRIELETIDRNRTSGIDLVTQEIGNLNTILSQKQVTLQNAERKISEFQKQRDELRIQWETINAEQFKFDDHLAVCPTCKQNLPAEDIDTRKKELETNFNAYKANRLSRIKADGTTARGSQESYEGLKGTLNEGIATVTAQLEAKKTELEELKKNLAQPSTSLAERVNEAVSNDSELVLVEKDIEKLEVELKSFEQVNDDAADGHKERKREIMAALDQEKKKLTELDQVTKTNERITQLSAQEKDLAQQVANLESIEFLMEEFTKAKIDILEKRINGRFRFVKFKLFDRQINGGEVPCCETTVNGVPFSDANNAARINAGLDIINTLSSHYDVYAPVFIDNAESVNELAQVSSQLIRLVVSLDKKLKIESSPQLEAAVA